MTGLITQASLSRRRAVDLVDRVIMPLMADVLAQCRQKAMPDCERARLLMMAGRRFAELAIAVVFLPEHMEATLQRVRSFLQDHPDIQHQQQSYWQAFKNALSAFVADEPLSEAARRRVLARLRALPEALVEDDISGQASEEGMLQTIFFLPGRVRTRLFHRRKFKRCIPPLPGRRSSVRKCS